MKKKMIFLMCLFLTLSAGKMMATTSSVTEKSSPVIAYSFELDNISELSTENLEIIVDEAFVLSDAQTAICTATSTISRGNVSIRVTVVDDCSNISQSARKAVEKAYEMLTKLTPRFN